MGILPTGLLSGKFALFHKNRRTDYGCARLTVCLDQSAGRRVPRRGELRQPVASSPVFCPCCFALIADGSDPCPSCGQSFDTLRRRSFPYRLIKALDHPLSVVRLRAIAALGCWSDRDAVDALVSLAHAQPLDVPQTQAVAEALAGMRPPAWSALNHLATEHPSHLTRLVARHKLTALWGGRIAPCCATADA